MVLDEAHLYRGAAGSEVALLNQTIKRSVWVFEAERLQIICTTASLAITLTRQRFWRSTDREVQSNFLPITETLHCGHPAVSGTHADATNLRRARFEEFYSDETQEARLHAQLRHLLNYRKKQSTCPDPQSAPFEALDGYPPLNLLVNLTMQQARPLGELSVEKIFPDANEELAASAITALTALGSAARKLPMSLAYFLVEFIPSTEAFQVSGSAWMRLAPSLTEKAPRSGGQNVRTTCANV